MGKLKKMNAKNLTALRNMIAGESQDDEERQSISDQLQYKGERPSFKIRNNSEKIKRIVKRPDRELTEDDFQNIPAQFGADCCFLMARQNKNTKDSQQTEIQTRQKKGDLGGFYKKIIRIQKQMAIQFLGMKTGNWTLMLL